MSNFMQYAHKMPEYQLRCLEGLNNEVVLKALADMAGEYGKVHSVEKLGEENNRNNLTRMYLISFENAADAKNAAECMEGQLLGKTAMMLALH